MLFFFAVETIYFQNLTNRERNLCIQELVSNDIRGLPLLKSFLLDRIYGRKENFRISQFQKIHKTSVLVQT